MSKQERLLNLTAALLATERPLTAEDLRARVPGYPPNLASFRRTFERDKDELRELGIPLRLVAITGADPAVEGYLIPHDEYYLADPGLEPDELAALHLAARAVRLEGLDGDEAIRKLGGAPAASEGGGSRAGVVELARLPGDARLADLFAAVCDRRRATFDYRGAGRTLEPHRLDFRRGHWYVSGHDELRGDRRSFRVDRIEGPVTLGEQGGFERRSVDASSLSRQSWELGEDPPVIGRLLVDADQAALALRLLGPDTKTEHQADGSVVFETVVTNRDAFRSFVLTFLDHGEILGPPELRNDVVEWLKALAGDGR